VALFVGKHFIKELKKLDSFKRKDYRASLQEAFLKMDQLMLTKDGKKELQKLANSIPDGTANGGGMGDAGSLDQSYAGCTANVVMITKTEIICANAGDSRSVLCKKGKSKDLSTDHKPDLPQEKRRIERANGFVEESRVNGMLALSRAIGDFEYKGNPILKPED
jgi:serine/threonine protein phosphatase PrpC